MIPIQVIDMLKTCAKFYEKKMKTKVYKKLILQLDEKLAYKILF